MKKTKKRVFGLLGLILVVVTTIFAAFLPGPGASAVGASSATDTVLVRVVGNVPDVHITNPANGSIFIIKDHQTLDFNYENINKATVVIDFTDKDGVTTTYDIDTFDSDYNPGSKTYSIDDYDNTGIKIKDFYGRYLIKVTGDGYGVDNVTEDLTEVFFIPVYGEAAEDEDDDSVYLDLYYDTENEDISTIGVNIYDEKGNLVKKISPVTIESPNTRVELPFSENGLPEGNYTIEITAYGEDGEALYLPYYTDVYYKPTPVPVPDTGTFFTNLGISKTDYMITGLIAFVLVAVCGIVFVAKGRTRKISASRR